MGTLFELHRAFKTVTLSDDEGVETTIGLRALDQETSEDLDEKIFALRQKAEEDTKGGDLKNQIAARASDFSRAQLTELILRIEQQVVQSFTDLAPGESEQAAVEKWRATRVEQLKSQDDKHLLDLYIERQLRVNIQNKSVNDFFNAQMVAMVVDPVSRKPILSLEPTDENYINRLMPNTRRLVHEAVQAFVQSTAEKNLRKLTKDGHFLPSGASPSPSPDSLGATTPTSPDSPPVTSDSSVSEPGSTG